MDGYNLKRSCWLEISLDNVRDNFFAFKKMVGPDVKVMPAVKANAYGHGIVPCGKELEACGADYLGMGSIGAVSYTHLVCTMLGAEMKDISYGSLLISDKIGDGSSREQAASNQKVLGGWANLAIEYSTKRYRSNCISWGLIPLSCKERPDLKKGDYLLLPDASGKISMGEEQLEGIILKTGEKVRLSIGEMTEEERRMLVLGGMINYYRSIR